jgi:hypothetical protein
LNYYVLAVDGKTYGPVDPDGLRQWVREGRIVAATRLREEESGREVAASDIGEIRELLGLGTVGPPGSDRYDSRRCPSCGGAMGAGQSQCMQCGSVPAYAYQPRMLITGSVMGDRIFGYLVGFFSWFVYGIGALGALVLYFVLTRSYPVFARGLGFGLLTMIVLVMGLFAICIVAMVGLG